MEQPIHTIHTDCCVKTKEEVDQIMENVKKIWLQIIEDWQAQGKDPNEILERGRLRREERLRSQPKPRYRVVHPEDK